MIYKRVRCDDADTEGAAEDPVLDAYLELLQEQMKLYPEMIQELWADSLERAQDLVGHIEVDANEDLGDNVTID
jgi:hypothetical protein